MCDIKFEKYIDNSTILDCIKKTAENINNDYVLNNDINTPLYAICLLKGGVMFYSELIKHLKMPVKLLFIALSSYGDNTFSSGKIQIENTELGDLNNKNVLIVDDIIDTGLTLEYFKNFLIKKYSPNSIKIAVLLNKEIKRESNIKPDYIAKNIENKFVIGFGMDYKGLYRNLDYIAAIKED